MVASFPAPQPKTEVVRTKKRTALEPWMVGAGERAFAGGLTIPAAARVLGIHPRTLAKWFAEAEEESCKDELLLSFVSACERGRANITDLLMGHLLNHAADDGKVALKLMEMVNPEWNTAKKVDVSATVTAAALVDYSHLSDDQMAVLAAADQLREDALNRAKARK